VHCARLDKQPQNCVTGSQHVSSHLVGRHPAPLALADGRAAAPQQRLPQRREPARRQHQRPARGGGAKGAALYQQHRAPYGGGGGGLRRGERWRLGGQPQVRQAPLLPPLCHLRTSMRDSQFCCRKSRCISLRCWIPCRGSGEKPSLHRENGKNAAAPIHSLDHGLRSCESAPEPRCGEAAGPLAHSTAGVRRGGPRDPGTPLVLQPMSSPPFSSLPLHPAPPPPSRRPTTFPRLTAPHRRRHPPAAGPAHHSPARRLQMQKMRSLQSSRLLLDLLLGQGLHRRQ